MQVKALDGSACDTEILDILPTYDTEKDLYAVAVVNKSADKEQTLVLNILEQTVREYRIVTVNGESVDAYNDIGHTGVTLTESEWKKTDGNSYALAPHSVNVIQLR